MVRQLILHKSFKQAWPHQEVAFIFGQDARIPHLHPIKDIRYNSIDKSVFYPAEQSY